MAERMERFKVNLAPFNEALEHVRSILPSPISLDGAYRSRGEQELRCLSKAGV